MLVEGFLGIDLGGTGAKAGVYDLNGKQLGFAQRGYQPETDENGYSEIPIEHIYNAARESVREAAAKSQVQIKAFAISSQGQTFVSLDQNDNPLHNAIMWYDARAGEQADSLRNAILSSDSEAECPLLQDVASAPKIMWLRERFPELMSRSRRHLLLPDFIYYKLTGIAATDPCIGASTGLYCDSSDDYSPAALSSAAIPREYLADIYSSGTPFAKITPEAAQEWGITPGAKAVVGTNDQYCGALGAGNCKSGIVSETTGTCLALVTLSEHEPQNVGRGLIKGRFPIDGYWYLLAYSKTAGIALDWFVREFGGNRSHKELDQLALSVSPGSSGVTIMHHFDGFISPFLKDDARGHIHGLSLKTKVEDVYRAFLESVAFSSRQHIESYRINGYPVSLMRSIGGGAGSDLWMQIKADVLGMNVERPLVTEAATLGAAMIAACGDGEFGSIRESSESLYKIGKVFEPSAQAVLEYDRIYEHFLELFERMYGNG